MTLYDILERGCGVHIPPQLDQKEHEPVLVIAENVRAGGGWGQEREGYEDSESFVLFEKDGAFWFYEESSDSTGHGCQCGENLAGPFSTLDDALRLGVGQEQADGLPENIREQRARAIEAAQ